jgi:hypothetical protein
VGKNELAKGSYSVVGVVANDGQKSRVDVRVTGPADQAEYQSLDVAAGKFGFTAGESGECAAGGHERGAPARCSCVASRRLACELDRASPGAVY